MGACLEQREKAAPMCWFFAAIERRAFRARNVVLSRLGRGRGEVRCGLC